MTVTDIMIIAVVAGLVSAAVWKMVRDKKRGVKCPGCGSCPIAGHCEAPTPNKQIG